MMHKAAPQDKLQRATGLRKERFPSASLQPYVLHPAGNVNHRRTRRAYRTPSTYTNHCNASQCLGTRVAQHSAHQWHACSGCLWNKKGRKKVWPAMPTSFPPPSLYIEILMKCSHFCETRTTKQLVFLT